MSDDRFKREPGEDEEPYVPRETVAKQKGWFQDVKPRTVTADEIFGWLDNVYCKTLGIKRDKKPPRSKP